MSCCPTTPPHHACLQNVYTDKGFDFESFYDYKTHRRYDVFNGTQCRAGASCGPLPCQWPRRALHHTHQRNLTLPASLACSARQQPDLGAPDCDVHLQR